MEPSAVVRVATFNIRTGRALDGANSWPLRRSATLAAARSLDADLLGVQEAYGFQLRWLVRRLGDAEAVGDGRDADRRGERCAVIVSQRSLRLVEHRTRWFGDTPNEPGTRLPAATLPRVATTAVVELADGRRLHFTSTHLDHRLHPLRRRSIRQLLGWLDPAVPQVLVGDMNALASEPLFADLAAAGFRPALPRGRGGTFHGFTGRRDGPRIDHILVNDRVIVVAARVVYTETGERLASDHWPVVAELTLR